MINVFLIPSWYPSQRSLISGIFTKEQSQMISEDTDIMMHVSILDEYTLSPRRLFYSFQTIVQRIQAKESKKVVGLSFVEYTQPVFSWSLKLFHGNMYNHINAHRKHLKQLLEEGVKIDIIHAHVSYPAGYIAYKLSIEFQIPYIITEHMSPFPFDVYLKGSKPTKELSAAIQNAKRVLAVSESQKKDIEEYGFDNISVIPNFINEDDYSPLEHKSNREVRFLTVGGLSHQKGIDILLQAIFEIKSEIKNAHFDIIGDGIDREKYINLSNALGIQNLLTFRGSIERRNIIYEFDKCDVFVLPSRHESFGIVYIEAMAMGKPLLGTKCGGPEMIINHNNGLLIEKDNVMELSQALKYMYMNYTKFSKENIREEFLNKFSKKINVLKYKELYKEVIQCAELVE